MPEIESVIKYIREQLPGLLASGENWKIILDGGKGGDVKARLESTRTQDLIQPKRQRLEEVRQR